jgi:hypothetical protein
MSTIGGANIIQDGLVFGYDADDRSTRYYPGEPTTNMVTNTDLTTWSENDTVLTENGMVNIDHHSFMSYKLTTDTGNSTHRLYAGQGAILSTSTNYNISLYAKANGYNYITFGMTDNTYYQTQTTFNLLNGDVELDYTSSGGTIIDSSSNYIGKGWYRLNLTISLSTYITANYFLMMVLDSVKNPPQTSWTSDGVSGILVSSPQIELKSHTTPYTPTSRSSTQGLLDLTGNNTIDLSNMSFDSTAHPIFDSTSQYISIDVDSWIRNVDYVTLTGWYYHNSLTSGAPWGIMTDVPGTGTSDGFWWHIAYTDGTILYLRTEDSTSGESGVSGTPFVSSGNWYHLTTIVGNSKFIIYVNGNLNWDWDTNVPFSWANINSDTAYLTVGLSYTTSINGKIPVFKLYNKALTQTEITQNFNATRNRFSI